MVRHMQRRDSRYSVQRMLKMELPSGRKRGKPQRRFMYVAKEDTQRV